jgi:hypothetical protein
MARTKTTAGTEPKPFVEIHDADWHRFFEINVMSGVRLERHYLTGMLKKNWPYTFCFERVGSADPGREGALRDDYNGANFRGSRDCGVGGRNRRDGEQYYCRADGAEAVGGFVAAMATYLAASFLQRPMGHRCEPMAVS